MTRRSNPSPPQSLYVAQFKLSAPARSVPDSGAGQDRRGVWSGAFVLVVLTRTVAWERSPHESQGWERQYGSTLHRYRRFKTMAGRGKLARTRDTPVYK